MSWPTSRLKHLCVDSGQYGLNVSSSEYSATGTRLVRTSDISDGGALREPEHGVFIDFEPDRRLLLRHGDLLLSRSGTLGRSLLVPPLGGGFLTFAGYLIRFRPRSDVDPRFLKYVAMSSPFQSAIESDAVESTIQNLNAERYASIEVPHPPLEKQRRIADFLDAEAARVDRLSKGRSSQIELLEARRQAVISEEYERLLAVCGGVRLRHAIQGIEQGWSPQCEDRPAESGEWGVIKAGCVNGGRFMEDQHKALPTDVTPRLEYRLRPGDLLMSRASGSPELIGSVAVVPPGVRNLLLCDKVYRIRLDGRRVRPRFFALMLRAHGNREHIKLGISGAEGMANNLPTAVVKNCLVPDATIDVQGATISQLDRQLMWIDELQRDAGRQLSVLAERRQALITAAVTGQFDVTTGRSVDLS